MRTLTSTVCILEPQVEAHAEEMFVVLSDPAIYEFERSPPPSVERLAAGYRRLETRTSPDGREQCLNWVVRLPTGEATGYVQAAVTADHVATIGYEFASRFWRRGIASAALGLMFDELHARYGVSQLVAVLKAANFRSTGLLAKLGFRELPPSRWQQFEAEPDELVMASAAVGPHGA